MKHDRRESLMRLYKEEERITMEKRSARKKRRNGKHETDKAEKV